MPDRRSTEFGSVAARSSRCTPAEAVKRLRQACTTLRPANLRETTEQAEVPRVRLLAYLTGVKRHRVDFRREVGLGELDEHSGVASRSQGPVVCHELIAQDA